MFSFGIEPSTTSTYGASSVPGRRVAERLHELLAAQRRREHLVVEVDLRQAGDRPEQHVLDGRLRGRGDRDRVPVAAHPLGRPQDVDLLDAGVPRARPRSWSSSAARQLGLRLHFQRLHLQLLALHDVHAEAAAGRAGQREGLGPGSRSRSPGTRRAPASSSSSSTAPSTGVPCAHSSKENASAEGTTWRRCPTCTQTRATRDASGVPGGDVHDGLGDRELVHARLSRSSAAGRRPACP